MGDNFHHQVIKKKLQDGLERDRRWGMREGGHDLLGVEDSVFIGSFEMHLTVGGTTRGTCGFFGSAVGLKF